jgi:hypothetical protein
MCSWPLLQAHDTVCGVHSAVELTGSRLVLDISRTPHFRLEVCPCSGDFVIQVEHTLDRLGRQSPRRMGIHRAQGMADRPTEVRIDFVRPLDRAALTRLETNAGASFVCARPTGAGTTVVGHRLTAIDGHLIVNGSLGYRSWPAAAAQLAVNNLFDAQDSDSGSAPPRVYDSLRASQNRAARSFFELEAKR